MSLNELRVKRAEAITQAGALIAKADTEKRDLTDAELAQVDGLIGLADGSVPNVVDSLDKQILRYGRAEGLAADLDKPTRDAVRTQVSAPTTMKRSAFEKLSPAAQSAFSRSGGKLTE